MEERDKLIEAARTIQEHCKHTEKGGLCALSYRGVCDGVCNCRISCEGGPVPGEDWEIQKPCRWTGRDYNLAKALDDFGVDVVEKCRNDGCVRFGYNGNSNEKDRLPVDSFSSLKDGELVELIDIIAEYEKCNGGK